MGIIDSDSLSDAQKQDAVAQMVAMTEIWRKETAPRQCWHQRGSDSVVSLSAGLCRRCCQCIRTTGCKQGSDRGHSYPEDGNGEAQNIVITPVHSDGK